MFDRHATACLSFLGPQGRHKALTGLYNHVGLPTEPLDQLLKGVPGVDMTAEFPVRHDETVPTRDQALGL